MAMVACGPRLVIAGMIDPSTTHSPSTPSTRQVGSTTAPEPGSHRRRAGQVLRRRPRRITDFCCVTDQFTGQLRTPAQCVDILCHGVVAVFDDRRDRRIGRRQPDPAARVRSHQRHTQMRKLGGVMTGSVHHGRKPRRVGAHLDAVDGGEYGLQRRQIVRRHPGDRKRPIPDGRRSASRRAGPPPPRHRARRVRTPARHLTAATGVPIQSHRSTARFDRHPEPNRRHTAPRRPGSPGTAPGAPGCRSAASRLGRASAGFR